MTRRLYLLASEQTISTLLQYASNSVGIGECQSHLFLRYDWHDSDFAKEIDFSKSFSCLIDVVSNCGYLNLANAFKNCKFDTNTSYETGFITFRKDDEFSFAFAFELDEGKNMVQNILRISGKVTKTIPASDNTLLSSLLSLEI